MTLISMVSGAVQSDMPPLAQASEREASLPWWAWLLIVLVLAWLLVRWLNRRPPRDITQSSWRRDDSPAGSTATPATGPAPVASHRAVEVPPVPAIVEVPPAAVAEPALVAAPPAAVAEPAAEVESTPAVVETLSAPVAEPAAVVESTPTVVETPSAPVAEPASDAIVEPAPAKPDDLTIIEGIGPKISALLVRSGIRTYAQLAAADVARLRQILLEVGYRVNDPTTWPEQGRLAAAGDWDHLKALQDELKGGRRV